MSRLRGPKAKSAAIPPPDLGLPPAEAAELERRLRTLTFRWKPMTSDPEGLLVDLYALAAWLLDPHEVPPSCPVLEAD